MTTKTSTTKAPKGKAAAAKGKTAKAKPTKPAKHVGQDLGELLAGRDAKAARKAAKAAKGKPAKAAPNGAEPVLPETVLLAIAAKHGFTWDENAQAAFLAAFAAGRAAKPARQPREGGKREIVAQMLQRADGATTRELLDATGWPAMSVPAMARASNLALRTEKRDGRTVYYGTPA